MGMGHSSVSLLRKPALSQCLNSTTRINFVVLESYALMVHITCGQVYLREKQNEWIRINTCLQGYRSRGMPHPPKMYVVENEWAGVSHTVLDHAPLVRPEGN